MSTATITPASHADLDDLAGEIRREHQLAEQHFKAAVAHAINAGQLLIEAKRQVKHGEWLPWLEANFPGSRRTATTYMKLAENGKRVSHLPTVREALAVLTTPKQSENDQFTLLSEAEVGAVEGFRSAKATAAEHGIELDGDFAREQLGEGIRRKVGQAALANGETDEGAALLGYPPRVPNTLGADKGYDQKRSWSYQGAFYTPPKDYAAAIAAHDRFQAISDKLRAKRGLPPVPELDSVRLWRAQLENNGKPPASPVEKVIACATRERANATGEDRRKIDAAIAVLKGEPRQNAQVTPPVPGLYLLPEPILREVEDLVAA